MPELLDYQVTGVAKIEEFKGKILIADDMGLGKTIQSLEYLARDKERRLPAIIVCPASVKKNWQREAKKHYGLDSEILEGRKPKQFSKRWYKAMPALLILNYDILAGWVKWLRKIKAKAIVFDECHNIKERTAARTRAAKKVAKGIPTRIALSGTALLNRPKELWPSLNILRPDLFGSFTEFGHEFCGAQMTRWGWDFNGHSNLKRLHRILRQKVMLRRRKKDVLKMLPKKKRQTLYLPLINRHEYQEAEEEFISWLRRVRPEKVKKAIKAERLVQHGYLKRLAAELKFPAALAWLKDWLSDHPGEKILIFGVHRSLIARLLEKFPLALKIDGSTPTKERQDIVDRFQRNSKRRILVCNLKAAGVGLNITAPNTVAFFEIGWVPGDLDQAEGRVHRIGQKRPVVCWYLIGKKTIEERVLKILEEKQKVVERTLDGKAGKLGRNIFDDLEREMLFDY